MHPDSIQILFFKLLRRLIRFELVIEIVEIVAHFQRLLGLFLLWVFGVIFDVYSPHLHLAYYLGTLRLRRVLLELVAVVTWAVFPLVGFFCGLVLKIVLQRDYSQILLFQFYVLSGFRFL